MDQLRPAMGTECATLVELLRWRATHDPELCAYSFLVNGEADQIDWTYQQIDRQARSIAARLQQLGMKGERALLLYPSGLEYLAAFFGCLYADVIAIPAYPPTPAKLKRTMPRLRAFVYDARPSVVLTISAIVPLVHELSAAIPDFAALRCITTETLEDLADTWRDPAISGDTLAFLQYTSGSTSAPKGVMVSHGNLLYNLRMLQSAFQHPQDAPFVSWLPLFHDMGLIVKPLYAAYTGVPLFFMSPMAFLQKPFRWLRAISRFRAHTSCAPNFAYDLCVRKVTPEQRATLDLSCWRLAVNGAEPVRRATLEQFAATFAACGFRREALYPAYGLAEATVFVASGVKGLPPRFYTLDGAALERNRVAPAPPEQAGARTLVKCGRTWLDQQILIVNPETLTRCAPDEVGEIWLSGPNIAQGYWNHAEETERTFRARLADGEAGRFLRTGDLGFLHDDELIITGRHKDLIIIDGHNYYPQDIEHTVEQSHPAIRPSGCAAFSVDVDGKERLVVVAEVDRRYRPQPRYGEHDRPIDQGTPAAPTTELIAEAIRRAVTEEHELQVRFVVLVKPASVFKTSSGKVQRQACRAAFLANSFIRWDDDDTTPAPVAGYELPVTSSQ